MPVHLYGQCAEMDPILAIAERHGLAVIEDAAQAIGAEYKGRRAGSMGRYGCFSFFPSKNLGAAGDGGMVTAQDAELAERLRVFRVHGSKPKYYHALIGGNFRFDALQAAIVSVKLRYLDGWTAGRQSNAARYRRLFHDAEKRTGPISRNGPESASQKLDLSPFPGLSRFPPERKWDCRLRALVQLPYEVPGNRHIYNQFIIRVPRRDELQAYLKERQHRLRDLLSRCRCTCSSVLPISATATGDFPTAKRPPKRRLPCRFIPSYPTSRPSGSWPASRSFSRNRGRNPLGTVPIFASAKMGLSPFAPEGTLQMDLTPEAEAQRLVFESVCALAPWRETFRCPASFRLRGPAIAELGRFWYANCGPGGWNTTSAQGNSILPLGQTFSDGPYHEEAN